MELTQTRQIGALIKGARSRAGLTQSQLAERIGVTREWVNRLENGTMTNPGFQQVLALFEAVDLGLNVTLPGVIPDHDTSDEYGDLQDLSVGMPDFSGGSGFRS